MEINLTHLIAFALGIIASAGKDALQIFLFKKTFKSLGEEDQDNEIDKIMAITDKISKGFGLNDPIDEEKARENNEPYYRSYYS